MLYDLEPATLAEIEAAMRPFIERFVVVEKRERAVSSFLPIKKRARPKDLVDIIDQRTVIALDTSARAESALAQVDNDLEGIYIAASPQCFVRVLDVPVSFAPSDIAMKRSSSRSTALEDSSTSRSASTC